MKMPPLEELLLPAISCPIEVQQRTRGGIRLRMQKGVLEVEIRNANGDVTYDKLCSREATKEMYDPYFAMVASNTQEVRNEIDIVAVYVKNLDDKRYTDLNALEEERLRFILKKHQGGVPTGDIDDTMSLQLHAHDLIALRLQDEMKIQQKKSLSYLDPSQDDDFEVVFKHMQTLKHLALSLSELQARMSSYHQDLMFSHKILVKPQQTGLLEEQYGMLKSKSESLLSEY